MAKKIRYNLERVLTNLYDEEMDCPTSSKPGPSGQIPTEPYTMRLALMQALIGELESDRGEPADKKLARYDLAQRIRMGGKQEFATADLKLLDIDRMLEIHGTMLGGQIRDFLDNPDIEDVDEETATGAKKQRRRRPARA